MPHPANASPQEWSSRAIEPRLLIIPDLPFSRSERLGSRSVDVLDRPVARLGGAVGDAGGGGGEAPGAGRWVGGGRAVFAAAHADGAVELLVVRAVLSIGGLDRDAGGAADEAADHRAD